MSADMTAHWTDRLHELGAAEHVRDVLTFARLHVDQGVLGGRITPRVA